MQRVLLSVVCLVVAARLAQGQTASNLMVNANFEHPEDPLKYWTYTYDNTNYKDNARYVKVLPSYGGKKNVLRVQVTDATAMGGGVWVDSPFVPFEQGCRYRFSMSFQSSGPYHLYVAGYQWKPGVKPYENPIFADMRLRYKGTFNTSADHGVRGGSWIKIVRDWPEKQMSNKAMEIIKDVRFMSLHLCGVTGKGEIYIKDLFVEKLPDKYTGGKITEDDRRTKQGSQ